MAMLIEIENMDKSFITGKESFKALTYVQKNFGINRWLGCLTQCTYHYKFGTLNIIQGPFFMTNSQLFHELIVSKSYTKDMEVRLL